MNATQASKATRWRVGIFTLIGLALIVGYTVLVNNRPFWWRPCQLVRINVEDATGLKTKAPIRSLGIDIGYLKSVTLTESYVSLGICVTAPVEVLPSTRAYIRGEGFLGDKFVELKPVKYVGPALEPTGDSGAAQSESMLEVPATTAGDPDNDSISSLSLTRKLWSQSSSVQDVWKSLLIGTLKVTGGVLDWLVPPAWAIPSQGMSGSSSTNSSSRGGKEIPVGAQQQDMQHLVGQVDELVERMSNLTDNLKTALNPEDLRQTMKQLNQTLENASKTLAPEGGLTQTAQRSLGKLEDAIEQMRDQMTRVNHGEGSVGMLLNDPSYAEEIREAVRNVNRLLSRVGGVRFVMDMGVGRLPAYDGSRGWLTMGIWPRKDRYYLVGISSDPRGRITNQTVTTTVGGTTQVTQTQISETTGILITGMFGKVFFDRIDVAIGALYGDGAASLGLRLGPNGNEEMVELRNDIYSRTAATSIDDRITLKLQPLSGAFKGLYLKAGLESLRPFPGTNQANYFYGAGIKFDDEDIKLLFALL